MRREIERLATLVGVGLFTLFIGAASAQTTRTATTRPFEVISVEGNQLVVRGPEGTKEYTVPETFRFTVDGKELSVHELKPGMKGMATVTTITTVKPVTVTEVKNGTVMKVAGNSVIVRGENGIRMFSEGDVATRNIRIMRGGSPIAISELREGDRLTATFITEKPPQVMTERQVNATLAKAAAGTAAAVPAASAPSGAMASGAPGSAGTTGAGGGRRLPKTASPLPLVGASGALLLAIGAGLTVLRRKKVI
jgi:hypothetical protein